MTQLTVQVIFARVLTASGEIKSCRFAGSKWCLKPGQNEDKQKGLNKKPKMLCLHLLGDLNSEIEFSYNHALEDKLESLNSEHGPRFFLRKPKKNDS